MLEVPPPLHGGHLTTVHNKVLEIPLPLHGGGELILDLIQIYNDDDALEIPPPFRISSFSGR